VVATVVRVGMEAPVEQAGDQAQEVLEVPAAMQVRLIPPCHFPTLASTLTEYPSHDLALSHLYGSY